MPKAQAQGIEIGSCEGGGKEGRNRIAVHLDHAHEAASIERVLVRCNWRGGREEEIESRNV